MASCIHLVSQMILLAVVVVSVNGQTGPNITQNATCGDNWIYHPHSRFSTTHLTWSEANVSCASTGGRLLPGDIQKRDHSLFKCLSDPANLALFPSANSSYVWVGQTTVTWYCPAVNLAHDERSITLNCYMTSRFLCIQDINSTPVTSMTPTSTTPTAAATTASAAVNLNCSTGYTLNSTGYSSADPKLACVDIDECQQKYCAPDADCTNSEGSYACRCRSGFSGDGLTCLDINECSTKPCDANATCTNTKGSFGCTCRRGYTGNGVQCTQLNECAIGIHNCAPNATCTDTPGSWTCKCNMGYFGGGTKCTDVNECRNIPCNLNATCTNTPGSFFCQCRPGYTGNGFNCSDVNECNVTVDGALNPCGLGRPCINTVSSYECPCQSNYSGVYECSAPATTLQAKTIISISSGIGAGVIGFVGVLLAALYMRSHNEVHRYLKQVILSPEDKPFTSTVGAAGDLPDPTDGPDSRHHGSHSSRTSSQISLAIRSNYAAFKKEDPPSSAAGVVEHEDEGLYVEAIGQR